ncbi:Xaa-Pro aminopeptidase 1 [Eumeta japonica]|uniref:Xaa-Pro aminopeptidase 1 n=1 Tax=Eumeta variegata TaxID=151549 RepID=A0A4C1Y1L4_EUMVA|nr:Xaa-Pro aminopeptidase 1 [Eumeta japonica]
MNARNCRGVTSALPVSRVGVEYLTDKGGGGNRKKSRSLAYAQMNPIDGINLSAHLSKSTRISPTDARRQWISEFTAGAGVAVVTADEALIWTDGRYFTQFYVEVDETVWSLMRQGATPSILGLYSRGQRDNLTLKLDVKRLSTDATIAEWLTTTLQSGAVVGIDPTTYTRPDWTALQASLQAANMSLQPTWVNLVDTVRVNLNDPPPARPNDPLVPLPIEFTGSKTLCTQRQKFCASKRPSLAKESDHVPNYPEYVCPSTQPPYKKQRFFPIGYLKARVPNQWGAPPKRGVERYQGQPSVILFWGNGVLTQTVQNHLSSESVTIETRPYAEIFDYLQNMATQLAEGSLIWLSQEGSEAIHLAAVGGVNSDLDIRTLSTVTPVALMKCVKNEVELRGFRNAHVKDGLAVVRFLRWLHERVDAGDEVTEMDASDELEKLRKEEEHFETPSFATIAGAGENGAIIHYRPSRDPPETVITKDKMFLVDSGGQYWDGTTDITRTRHMNYTPSDWQRMTFTRVMKGQISLATAVFPRGTRGHTIDILARKYLFEVGLDYAHGTGHGVGHYLNVHEGPSGISSGVRATDPGIVPGMIFSNEPGYYEVGEFGIRHEDLVEVIEVNRDADHILADVIESDFDGRGALGFYTISLAPHQTSCLDIDLMTDHELEYLNDYHARVLNTLGPILKERGLDEDYAFLERECAPLTRDGNAAHHATFSAALLGLSVFALWLRS